MSPRILDLIKGRRSIRKYTSKEVPRDILFNILEAARWAPSAHNAQPWRFIIITERSLKRKLEEQTADEWIKDKLMRGLGLEVSAHSVANLYKDFLDVFILDAVDLAEKARIEKLWLKVRVTNTVMKSLEDKIELARVVLEEIQKTG